MYASEWPEPGLSSTVEGRGRRADERTGGRTNGRRTTTTTASSAGMSDRRRARTGGGGGEAIRESFFLAFLVAELFFCFWFLFRHTLFDCDFSEISFEIVPDFRSFCSVIAALVVLVLSKMRRK